MNSASIFRVDPEGEGSILPQNIDKFTYKTNRCHNSKDQNLNSHCCVNLITYEVGCLHPGYSLHHQMHITLCKLVSRSYAQSLFFLLSMYLK
jgi:hypothetical protein